jgi:hypothetical protein
LFYNDKEFKQDVMNFDATQNARRRAEEVTPENPATKELNFILRI